MKQKSALILVLGLVLTSMPQKGLGGMAIGGSAAATQRAAQRTARRSILQRIKSMWRQRAARAQSAQRQSQQRAHQVVRTGVSGRRMPVDQQVRGMLLPPKTQSELMQQRVFRDALLRQQQEARPWWRRLRRPAPTYKAGGHPQTDWWGRQLRRARRPFQKPRSPLAPVAAPDW